MNSCVADRESKYGSLSSPPETDFMKSGISFSVIFNLLIFRNTVTAVVWVGWFEEFQYRFIKNTMVLKPVLVILALSKHLIFIGFFPPFGPNTELSCKPSRMLPVVV